MNLLSEPIISHTDSIPQSFTLHLRSEIAILLNLVGVLFITKLNDDEGEIYAYLAYQYFGKNKKVSNVDIYETIKQYYNKTYDETISDRKINSVLKRLENDLRVIEFVDGYLVVKDEIYFE